MQVGTDRNVRSCIQVGESNKCMSGDIFPSKELCMNPNLDIILITIIYIIINYLFIVYHLIENTSVMRSMVGKYS